MVCWYYKYTSHKFKLDIADDDDDIHEMFYGGHCAYKEYHYLGYNLAYHESDYCGQCIMYMKSSTL